MSFFYDLNARLAKLAAKQEAKQITESAEVAESKFSKLAKEIGKNPKVKNPAAVAATIGREKYGQKAMTKKSIAGKKAHEELDETGYPSELDEKWAGDTKLNPEKKGMFKGKSKADLEKQLARLHKTGPHKKGSPEYTKQQELNFAIRAKSGWKEGEEMADEGNAFTGKLASTPKGGKFKLGNKEFKDTSSIEEADVTGLGEEEMDEGYAEMDAWLKNREKEKGTGKFDKKKISTGTVYTRKHEEEPEDDSDAPVAKGGAPKKKGRPAGTRRAIGAKHSGRSKLARMASIAEDGEYDQEGEMAKGQIHTIVRHAKELESILHDNENLPEWVQEKLGQIKGMMTTVADYMLSNREQGIEHATGKEGISIVPEVAPPGAKAERMVKHIKKAYSKDGKLTPKEKSIAYATAWKAHNKGQVEEEGTKPDFLDVDKDGDKQEPMKQAAKQAKSKKKEEVEETTNSGSVATASAAPKSSKGMQFGKGVYESLDSKLENIIAEGMSINVNMNTEPHQGEEERSITVQASGEDADKLVALLKMAGLGQKQEVCPTCGEADCGCEEELDENSPDWPTNTEKIDAEPNLRTYSGGLNGPKSSGQSTTVGGGLPNLDARRQVSMEESVELERTLFKTWKNYKG